MYKKSYRSKTEEMNKKADLVVQEARLAAKRILDEADMKSEKVMAKAENRNEAIKQKKIREAKERFSTLKAEYDEYRVKKKIEFKERETRSEERRVGKEQ